MAALSPKTLSLSKLGLLLILAACRGPVKGGAPTEEAGRDAPIPDVLLNEAPQAQENMLGTGALDSMNEEAIHFEPLPEASEGSPYQQSYQDEEEPRDPSKKKN